MVSHLILAIPALKHQVNLIISISICTHKSNGTKRDLTKRDIIENKLPFKYTRKFLRVLYNTNKPSTIKLIIRFLD